MRERDLKCLEVRNILDLYSLILAETNKLSLAVINDHNKILSVTTFIEP